MLVHSERAETGWQLTLPAGTTDIKVTCHQSDRNTKGVLHYHPSLNHTNPESPRECILIALFLQTCCNLQKDSLTLWKSFSKRISSLCQKKKKRMCQSIFVSAIESALFPVGCLCVHPCVCACVPLAWSRCRWLAQRGSVTDGEDQGDLPCLLLEKHNYWKSGKWDHFWTFLFCFVLVFIVLILWSFQHFTFERMTLLLREKDQQLTISFQSCLW